MGERIKIQAGDRAITAYRAAPEQGGPGVLVLHAWWGLTETFTSLCDRLAAEGFTALAPDFYGDKTADTIEGAEALVNALDFGDALGRVRAAGKSLLADSRARGDRFGAIGFSMGANLLSWYIREQPALAATVFFYGGAEGNQELAGKTKTAILGHFAENDEWEQPVEETLRLGETLRAADLDVTFHVYPGTGHWFFEENRPDAYDAEAAQLAWDRTVTFLREQLQPGR